MSLVDDQLAEHEAAIENAKHRIAHGKHFVARDLAVTILALRELLLEEYDTLENVIDALRSAGDDWRTGPALVVIAKGVALSLLEVALINPKSIWLIGEAFKKIEDEGKIDPRATEIITAYENCEWLPPSFRELKREFISRFGKSRWPGDFAVRDRLRNLGLSLQKGKPGRPKKKASE
jgi:hypothetical protein